MCHVLHPSPCDVLMRVREDNDTEPNALNTEEPNTNVRQHKSTLQHTQCGLGAGHSRRSSVAHTRNIVFARRGSGVVKVFGMNSTRIRRYIDKTRFHEITYNSVCEEQLAMLVLDG